MGAYLVRRLALMVLTLFGISVLIFVLLRIVPGNITDIIFDSAGFVNERQKKKIEQELGLDQPIVTQYGRWIAGLAKGDLGYAYVSEKPAIDEILPRIPVTAKLAVLETVSPRHNRTLLTFMTVLLHGKRNSGGTENAIEAY